jgi:hypothetical protein
VRLVDLAAEDGETLPDADASPLLDRLGIDLACGTLVARGAERALAETEPGDRRLLELERLLAPPTLASRRSRDLGGVVLAWDESVASRHAIGRRDADRTGLPDLAEAAAADVAHALERLRALLGWDGPSAAEPLQVVLAVSEHAEGRAAAGASPHVVLPIGLGGEDRLRAAAHQLAHVALGAIAPVAPGSWEEALAVFLAERIVADAIGEEVAPLALLAAAGREGSRRHALRAFGTPQLAGCRSDAAFLAYLDGTLGLAEGWAGELWSDLAERLSRRSSEADESLEAERLAIESLDALLGRSGSDLTTAVASYFTWSLEADLQAGPGVSVDAALNRHPTIETRSGHELPPFSQLRYAVAAPRSGGLRLRLESDARTEAEVFALLADATVERFPLGSGAFGDRSVRLPGGRLVAVVVLVSAPLVPADLSAWSGRDQGAPGDFRLFVEEDAAYPFVLEGLAGEARVEQVRVDWTTSSEEDLVAWHVERSRRLAGPWRRVSAVPLPPSSRPGETWSYSLVDPTVRPGTRYHYRLAASTTSGLTERTASVTVLTLPDGPSAAPGDERR